MKPYKNGETPSTAKAGRKPKKKPSTATKNGGVKKAVSQAKASAIKTKRKITTKTSAKDEIDGLIEQTANDPNLNGSYVEFTPTRSNPKGQKGMAKATQQLRKMKSMVKSNSHSKLQEEPETPVRRSGRNKIANGHSGDYSFDEVAMEATETTETTTTSNGSAARPGFFKRTMSKIWNIPHEVNSVASYDTMDGPAPVNGNGPANGHDSAHNSRSSCVIS